MIKIGITGQNGFIGSHLYNYLSLFRNEYKLIPFENIIFNDENKLIEFVSNCDVIIHLAALNRHHNENEIIKVNIELVEKLISAISKSSSRPHIIFSSSTQEKLDNPYGLSKKMGRKIFIEWAKKLGYGFTGLVIPNVFGPFGKPYYNSVVSTFSHQLIVGEEPNIINDKELNLIYVQELCDEIHKVVINYRDQLIEEYYVPSTYSSKVSKILKLLEIYYYDYIENKIIPELINHFDINLFNTFRSYINYLNFFPVFYKTHSDERGIFSELVKSKIKGQISFSTTKPGVTRGNHFHTRKIERFSVIKGKAKIQIRKYNTNDIIEFTIENGNPGFVDMPIWYTHNLINIGEEELYTVFWINEFYNVTDPDTYFEPV
ncbi:polysaccharide biosynthesis C-terminal domain-containing protein [Rosettibacter firmus]|uniref:polysaccharide biosynthesis C-terminal domain-containing protein n=1 Tax=Rosettibacter firmus TaxID=3111522 RepID=UPI00336BC7C2